MPRTRWEASPELLEDARKAKAWYDTTGMKVAQTPAIPRVVASWLLLHCAPTKD